MGKSKRRVGVYAGSFDPVTKGHIDIIKRSFNIVDKLVIGLLNNSQKTTSWFQLSERIKMLDKIIQNTPELRNKDIEIHGFNGLLVDFVDKFNASLIIRGLRAVSDYEYELQLFLGNSILAKTSIETVFLPSSREFLYLSSSMIKEIAINNGDLSAFINKEIIKDINYKVEEIKESKVK